MKAPIVRTAVLSMVLGLAAVAQTPPASQTLPTAAPAEHQTDEEGDRFGMARAAADDARKTYEKADGENIGEVDRLLKTKRCQSTRIDGLLNRTIELLDAYLSAESYYFTSWNEAETKRVESQQRSLASLENDEKRAADLVDGDKQDREELIRKKASLEKSPRTAQITAEIDGLIKDIQDSEARLSEAQKQFEEITSRLNDMKANISARLVSIRQNIAQLDTYRLEEHAAYEGRRKAAHEICNTKQPDLKKSLPKRDGGQ